MGFIDGVVLTRSTEAAKLDEEEVPVAPKKTKKKTKGTPAPPVEVLSPPELEREPVSGTGTPDADGSDNESKAPELSKREKRRAREAKKKAEEEAAKLAAKEARKEAKKAAKAAPPPPEKEKKRDDAFVMPKSKKKGKGAAGKVEKVVVTDEEVARAAADITALRGKMVDKWDADWTGEL